MMYRYKTRIHFDLCDPAGIIFYGNVFEIAHRALEELVVNSGIKWDDWFASKSFVVPIVHAQVDYESPLKSGYQVEVETSIERIGKSSVTIAYRIVDDKTLYATAKTVHVFMDTKTGKKTAIPEDFRKKLV